MSRIIPTAFAALSLATATAAHAQSPKTRADVALTFLSHRSGYNQAYRSEPDGSNPQPFFGGPITDIPSFDDSYRMFREPHWTRQSPDGKYFASWVYEVGQPYSEFQGTLRPMLWVGDINGTWTRVVNPDCGEEFAWSPDSTQLAFSVLSTAHYGGSLQERLPTTEICISGIDGSNSTCVIEQDGKWFVLDWSPDGERLLITRRTDGDSNLLEFRLADAIDARKRAEYDPEWSVKRAPQFLEQINLEVDGEELSSARYSPTRNEIAILTCDPKNMYAPNLVADDEFGRMRMMRFLGKIHVFNLETREARKIADYDDGIRGPICWSPNGNDVYFSRYLPKDDDREKFAESKEHGLSIWAVGRDGKNPRFITTGWSPDFPRTNTEDGK